MHLHVAMTGSRLGLLLTACALLAAPWGCSSNAPPADPEVVQVTALLAGRHATLLRARATRETRPLAPSAPAGERGIRWELVDPDGVVIARGTGPDVHAARYEFGEEQRIDPVQDPRSAAGTLSFEIPNVGGTLHFWEADGTSAGQAQFGAIAPKAPGVSEASLVNLSTDVLGAPVALVDHGSPRSHVNFLLLPDGYTEAELPQFHEFAAKVASGLSQIPGYSDHWDDINVYYQDVRSKDSGIADPKQPEDTKTTAFETTFGDGATSPRRCILPSNRVSAAAVASMLAIGRSVSADQIVIIANTHEYGGCAIPGDRVAVMSATEHAIRIMAHEIGHSLFKLADEYTDSPPACDASRWKKGTPNVGSDLDALPWRDLIPAGASLPTSPGDTSTPIGAFEGAGYCTTGAYRASEKCMMHTIDQAFCPVCKRELDRYFAAHTGGDRITDVQVRNMTGQGLFAGCEGTASETCSPLTYVGPKQSVTIHTHDGAMILDTQTIPQAPVHWSFEHVTAPSSQVTIRPDSLRPLG